jgi:hypothetical protein
MSRLNIKNRLTLRGLIASGLAILSLGVGGFWQEFQSLRQTQTNYLSSLALMGQAELAKLNLSEQILTARDSIPLEVEASFVTQLQEISTHPTLLRLGVRCEIASVTSAQSRQDFNVLKTAAITLHPLPLDMRLSDPPAESLRSIMILARDTRHLTHQNLSPKHETRHFAPPTWSLAAAPL